MHYILDTDWALNAIARRRGAGAALRYVYPAGVAVSYVTVGEVYEGAFAFPNHEAHLERFHRFLSSFQLIGLDDEIMHAFAQLRASLRRRGVRLPDFDLVIAATALSYNLTLLTFNRQHFARIPDLRLYEPHPDPG